MYLRPFLWLERALLNSHPFDSLKICPFSFLHELSPISIPTYLCKGGVPVLPVETLAATTEHALLGCAMGRARLSTAKVISTGGNTVRPSRMCVPEKTPSGP